MVRLRAGGAWLTVAACAGASLPAVVSTIRGLADGAYPNGDRGIVATRAYDVFTRHTPLVGQFSATTLVVHKPTHSAGPMLYWLLSVPARIGPAAMTVTMGLVSVACAVGIVLIARGRGGGGFMLVTAAAVALMSRSLPAETFHDIWNPSVGVMPLALLMFLCWPLAAGGHRLLPLAVLVASYAAQAELTFLLPSAGLLAIGVAGLLVTRRRGIPGWWIAAAAVGLVCWTAPIADEIVHRPGNITLLARAATANEPSLGATAGWRAVVRAVGVPPRWLRIPSQPFDRSDDVATRPPAASQATAALILLGLALAAAGGILRRRLDVAAPAFAGLFLCGALFLVAADTPTRPILMKSIGYTLWWGSPAGMFAWLVLGWSAFALLPLRLPPLAGVRVPAAAAGAAAAIAAGIVAGLSAKRDQDRAEYKPLATLTSRARTAIPHVDHTIRIAGSSSFTAFDFKGALIYALRSHGVQPVVVGATRRLGSRYEARRFGYDATLYVWDGPVPLHRGPVVVNVPLAAATTGTIAVTLASGPDALHFRGRAGLRPAADDVPHRQDPDGLAVVDHDKVAEVAAHHRLGRALERPLG